ncbi:MAG: hypothetical protein LRY49_06555 [Burkholderiaceae bacterium]|nr:hypothetical protein [Burkholderiaceae bacterium]
MGAFPTHPPSVRGNLRESGIVGRSRLEPFPSALGNASNWERGLTIRHATVRMPTRDCLPVGSREGGNQYSPLDGLLKDLVE